MTATATTTVSAARHRFDRLLAAEWTKIRSVRSTVWSLLALVLLNVGLTILFMSFTVSQWDNTDAADREQWVADPTSAILGSGMSLSQLAVCVLGVMVITSEYATGMIRTSLLAVPRRTPMLAAKAVVLALVALVLGLVVSFVSFFIGSAIMRPKAAVVIGDPGVARAVTGGALYLAMLGLFALAIGAIIRHTAAAITAVIGFVLVLSPLAQLLPGSVGEHVYAYLPAVAGAFIMKTHQLDGDLLSPWQGYGVFALWTAALLVIAFVLLRRRDA